MDDAGQIAALVAAGAFLMLVLVLAVPILRLRHTVDAATQAINDLNDRTGPLLTNVTATVDNRVAIPARTLVALSGRYRFTLMERPATLRVAVNNLADVYGYDLKGAGAYDVIAGRLASAYVSVDF